ncbi:MULTISPECIES: carbohydrate ABC transporter permease [unclassified Fusibacter]|uniref:carbohydrate ABC transporter permease n=1 Tax=unclassified Fusibacter TaxID=2624464 RepID=UPI001013296F|nr:MULTISPECIES: carbohydrate ABC transporter permease [unclassified Fusibacter]MCK8059367.1 carbohydrate ABC transporter permease [Fusibacter sp. A2]NPE21169.1 carbohydrate ABC transporter permease [Fusibacter sp. A1]RXV62437.1 carbohydrate ABC transporter permease [Fusibacter sp. A1]
MRDKKKLSITLMILLVFFVLPLFVTITNAFMTADAINEAYPLSSGGSEGTFFGFKLIPEMFSINQFYTVLVKEPLYLKLFWNSVFVVLPILFGQLLVATMAGYAFAKFKFKGKNLLFLVYLILMVMPFQVTLVPNYLVMDYLGLINTKGALILPGVFSAFGVFLMTQFVKQIPNELFEQASVDGCSQLQVFFKIVVPLARNGILALGMLIFIDYWNMVEQPLVLMKEVTQYPLSVFLSFINDNQMGVAFASSLIYMVPVLIVFGLGEKYLIDGISQSAIK